MNNFNTYEGFKMALITCNRTLSVIDGMEVTSKLLWALLSLYQALIYAMLFDRSKWKIERTEGEGTNSLIKAIELSKKMIEVAPFVNQYHTGQEEKAKIDDIQKIRDNVIHANAEELIVWEKNIAYLKDLMKVGARIAVEITQVNEKSSDEISTKMRQFCEYFKEEIIIKLSKIPSS